jgi:hypothetical protein
MAPDKVEDNINISLRLVGHVKVKGDLDTV